MRDNPPRPLPCAGTRTPFAFSTKVSDLAPLITSVKIAERIGDQAWPRERRRGSARSRQALIVSPLRIAERGPTACRAASCLARSRERDHHFARLGAELAHHGLARPAARPQTGHLNGRGALARRRDVRVDLLRSPLSISNRLALRDQLDREVAIARCDDSCRDRRAGHALCLGQRTLHRFRSSSPWRSSPADSASSSARSRLQSQAASIAA